MILFTGEFDGAVPVSRAGPVGVRPGAGTGRGRPGLHAAARGRVPRTTSVAGGRGRRAAVPTPAEPAAAGDGARRQLFPAAAAQPWHGLAAGRARGRRARHGGDGARLRLTGRAVLRVAACRVRVPEVAGVLAVPTPARGHPATAGMIFIQ